VKLKCLNYNYISYTVLTLFSDLLSIPCYT